MSVACWGLEPLYLACEGTMVIIAPKEEASKIVETLRQCPYSENAAIIGEITEEQYAQAADDTYAIYSSKYGVSMETENGLGSFAVGQSTDPNFSTLVDLLRTMIQRLLGRKKCSW